MVERFTMTSHPVEGGAMDAHPHGDYVLYSDFAELAAENERLAEAIEEMEYSDGDASFWRHIAKQNAEALSRTGAVKVELSENTGELIDKIAEAIRGDTTSDDTPWATLSEDRKIGWRGDAERALAVVKEHLTARCPSEQVVTEAMSEAAVRAVKCHLYNNGDGKASFIRECDIRAAIRAALKAAMEAGRHD